MISLRWRLRWFFERLWNRIMRKAGQSVELRNQLGLKTPDERYLEDADNLVLMTSVIFTLEALERSENPVIAERAAHHLQRLRLARYHRHQIDAIRELPPPLAPARKAQA